MTTKQYRQGDVLLQRVAELPENLKPMTPENGRVILAHGEVTGHHHSFAPAVAEKMTGDDGAEYFRVTGEKMQLRLPILRRWRNQVMVQHPQHGVIEFAVADVAIEEGEAVIDGEYGLLTHQEHNAHAIPAGLYIGGTAGGAVRQREYSPEAIRNVAD